MGRIWLIAAVTTCALLTTACGHSDSAARNTTTTPATQTNAALPKEPTRDISTLPMCGDAKTAASGMPEDCKLVSRDSAGFSFVVRHAALERTSAGGDTRVVAIDVVSKDVVDRKDYAVGPTIVEAGSELMGGEPMLKDIDADGRDELLVPLGGGSGGTTFAIYRDTVADSGETKLPDFVKVGEVTGTIPEHTDSGYIAVRGKGSCCEWEVGFYKIENSLLRQYVRVEIDATMDSAGHGHGTCKVIDSSGLAGSGLNDSQLTQRFCAEPFVLQSMPYR